ncbi:MAG: cysteine--tRNA ligase [Methanobacteriota archaeon]
MALTIYNSLTRKKEPFTPLKKNKVGLYVCGMTVYSDAHIGHARTYLAFDIIRRYLEYKGYQVTYIQNITDVDDKIIAAAQKEHIDPLAYSQRYADRCLHDMDALGIRRASQYPKASETIPEMITMIQEIIKKGYAYVADGDVYYSVEHFTEYGQLSGQNIKEMKAGARIEPGEQKQNPLDFALWKKTKPGEPAWDSPWGSGRPGWHIECSAMSNKYLGVPFDIHGGGMDLRFPHHENEIAQTTAATGKPAARYWMHIGLLTVNSEKMSKSLGNIVNIHDLLQTWDPEVIRMFFAQTQYRSPPDYTEKALQDIQKSLSRLYRLKEKLEEHAKHATKKPSKVTTLTKEEKDYAEDIITFTKEFENAMDDDFNTPRAFAILFEFVNTSNRFFENHTPHTPAVYQHALHIYLTLGDILTLFQTKPQKTQETETDVDTELQTFITKYQEPPPNATTEELIKTLLQIRETARTQKDWTTADHIRKHLEKIGYEIQDTDTGPVWRKKAYP